MTDKAKPRAACGPHLLEAGIRGANPGSREMLPVDPELAPIPYKPPSKELLAMGRMLEDARWMTSHPQGVSGDGVALTSALHPSNPCVAVPGNAAERNLLVVTQTMEDGTMREFKADPSMLTGAHSWSASLGGGIGAAIGDLSGGMPLNECAPAGDAKDGSPHWVEIELRHNTANADVNASSLSPIYRREVWKWMGHGSWEHDDVAHAYMAGYRYLGPAEYVAPSSHCLPRHHDMDTSTDVCRKCGFDGEFKRDVIPLKTRHIRMGQPAPAGDTHVVIAAEDYERWRGNRMASIPPSGEIPVTPEMTSHGVQCALDHPPSTAEEDVNQIYRAMAALGPVEPVSERERITVKERDEAVRKADEWFRFWEEARDELNRFRDMSFTAKAEYLAQLATKEARIAELDSELARRPLAFVDPAPEPKRSNPFREFPNDPRRMGP